ncbi:TetR/AcrR family transcriptional regulator [Enterococcus saccharolyticus]|uniref:TetR family transcriptional regulator n=1 Tax=Candidatus Enterococcus willemsii TaxID=1857215 RepID=A0ABQ6YWP4_9ENTE|nr:MULTISPECIES: TetR/AcrR family transcriptional regulator [Enterococcus]KAF1301903.1 TetR family transcriptional regulator [Enterococcus sp. CU12B]MCD5003466.1 TetR/AcrR family transcriptional regulator [Enterococcus saccharolyticus]
MAEGKKTKAAIASAYIQLCEEKEYAKISVQDIALKASINRQTFYYHFQDKNELLRWVYFNDSLKFLASKEVKLDNWEEQALKMLKRMQEKQVFYQNTMIGNRTILINEFFTVVQSIFRQLFRQVDEEKVLSKQDIDFYSRFFSFGCSGILEAWICGNFQESALEIATQLFRLAQDIEVFSYRIYQRKEE